HRLAGYRVLPDAVRLAPPELAGQRAALLAEGALQRAHRHPLAAENLVGELRHPPGLVFNGPKEVDDLLVRPRRAIPNAQGSPRPGAEHGLGPSLRRIARGS